MSDGFFDEIAARIKRFGHTFVGVGDGEWPFCYSVGHDISLIVTGTAIHGPDILRIALKHVNVCTGDPFKVGESGYQAVFAPVPQDQFESTCTVAIAMGAQAARQFIIQDNEHQWPWDPGYHIIGSEPAPVLAGAGWRPNS